MIFAAFHLKLFSTTNDKREVKGSIFTADKNRFQWKCQEKGTTLHGENEVFRATGMSLPWLPLL
jgi:hypothetical protein